VIQRERYSGAMARAGSSGLALILLMSSILTPLGGNRPADAATSLGVDPLTVEADARAGEDFVGVINVQLTTDPGTKNALPEHILIRPADWDMKPDGALQFAPPGTFPHCCTSWVEVNPAEFDLNPGQSVEVRYTVHLPPNLPNGTYWTAILSRTMAIPAPGEKGLMISSAVATILYLTVGPHDRKGRITGFSADTSGTRLTLVNEGSDPLRITGNLDIVNSSGKLVRELDLTGAVALPGENREREINLTFPPDLKLPPGQYQLTALLDYRGDALIGARTHLEIPAAPPRQNTPAPEILAPPGQRLSLQPTSSHGAPQSP